MSKKKDFPEQAHGENQNEEVYFHPPVLHIVIAVSGKTACIRVLNPMKRSLLGRLLLLKPPVGEIKRIIGDFPGAAFAAGNHPQTAHTHS